MAQLVTRIDEALALKVDEMILSGVAENRSELVRLGLEQMIDRFERERTGAAQASDETTSGSVSRLETAMGHQSGSPLARAASLRRGAADRELAT